MSLSPLKIILIGFALVVLGVVLPFLMVLHIIESTFFLNFFSYGASLVGLFLGLIGSSMYVRVHRKKPRGVEPEDGPADGENAVGSTNGNDRPTNDV
jgi:hypothetical protein